MARQSQITPEVQAGFCAMVSLGCTRRTAARLSGQAESTMRHALRRDAGFAARLRAAEQSRELIPLRNVQAAGAKSWRAAAWLLERLDPATYGKRKPGEMTRQEVASVVEQIGQILADAVTQPDDRAAVQRQLGEFIERMRRETDEDS